MRDRGVEIKKPEQIDQMRAAGLVVGETLELLRRTAKAGMTTLELDAVAEDNIRSSGAVPSFKGYAHPPFPASICASVNDEIVHGIPGDRVLADGDIISIDCGAIVDGWHGDAAITVAIGEVPAETTELMGVTEESLVARYRGRPARRPGHRHLPCRRDLRPQPGRLRHPRGVRRPRHRLGDAPAAERPQLRQARARPQAGAGPRAGGRADGGPRRQAQHAPRRRRGPCPTADGSLAAHFEHTFTLTAQGAWVLTALDGGEAKLAELGVPFGPLLRRRVVRSSASERADMPKERQLGGVTCRRRDNSAGRRLGFGASLDVEFILGPTWACFVVPRGCPSKP